MIDPERFNELEAKLDKVSKQVDLIHSVVCGCVLLIVVFAVFCITVDLTHWVMDMIH